MVKKHAFSVSQNIFKNFKTCSNKFDHIAYALVIGQ